VCGGVVFVGEPTSLINKPTARSGEELDDLARYLFARKGNYAGAGVVLDKVATSRYRFYSVILRNEE
jgi:hypothetical protein